MTLNYGYTVLSHTEILSETFDPKSLRALNLKEFRAGGAKFGITVVFKQLNSFTLYFGAGFQHFGLHKNRSKTAYIQESASNPEMVQPSRAHLLLWSGVGEGAVGLKKYVTSFGTARICTHPAPKLSNARAMKNCLPSCRHACTSWRNPQLVHYHEEPAVS